MYGTSYNDNMGAFDIFKELWLYVKKRKQWVIVPLMFFLIALGFLLVFAETSIFAPIIYTLF